VEKRKKRQNNTFLKKIAVMKCGHFYDIKCKNVTVLYVPVHITYLVIFSAIGKCKNATVLYVPVHITYLVIFSAIGKW
jgi:hypothetical protein